MTETYYYSAITGGFYAESNRAQFENSPTGWPEDAVAVSTEEYARLFAGQANGRCIVPGPSGRPVLSDPPEPSYDQLVSTAEARKASLLSDARAAISVWQTKLLMGRKLTDAESASLNAWIDYIDVLTAINTSIAPDINWPVPPEE